VASKLAGNSKAKATTATVEKPVGNAIAYSQAVNTATPAAFVVPGLPSHITPDAVVGMLPKFDESAYQIIDPLNPPETLPQATEAQFDKGMRVYEGAQRALKLTGAAFDTTKERFTTLGKQARAFGSGIKAATEFERVKGDFIDYQGQLQTNEQKNISLSVSQHKTTTDRTAATHTTESMDEKLKQAEIAAELARATTQDKQNKLDEFRKSLGEYAA
jgi:DNA-binding ferritin-like protein